MIADAPTQRRQRDLSGVGFLKVETMASKLKPGDIIKVQLYGGNGLFYQNAELLPELSVCFGGGSNEEEPPLENIPDESEAFRIARERYPDAFFEDWLTCYGGTPYLHEGVNGGWSISIFFYPADLDVVRDWMLPRESSAIHWAGIISWSIKLLEE